MGFTTRTASVVPAPRPAAGGRNPRISIAFGRSCGNERTQEDTANGGVACFGIGEPALVSLETGKAGRHLWNYAGEHSTEALVQCERRLAPHNHGTSGEEATGFGLYFA